MKVIAIIQARIDSRRLPGKVLFDLAGKTVLEHVVRRVKAAEKIEQTVVATSVKKGNIEVVRLCENIGVDVFRGSEDDVLDRFYQVASFFSPEHIVRITADCPLLDPKIIDVVIMEHLKRKADYTSNTLLPTYPNGEDIEIFRLSTLEEAWRSAKLLSEREHVTPYIIKHPEKFKLFNVKHSQDFSHKRWTLDTKEDYLVLKTIFNNLYPQNALFGMKDVLNFLKKNPSVEKINTHINRNEGYLKSLREDRIVR